MLRLFRSKLPTGSNSAQSFLTFSCIKPKRASSNRFWLDLPAFNQTSFVGACMQTVATVVTSPALPTSGRFSTSFSRTIFPRNCFSWWLHEKISFEARHVFTGTLRGLAKFSGRRQPRNAAQRFYGTFSTESSRNRISDAACARLMDEREGGEGGGGTNIPPGVPLSFMTSPGVDEWSMVDRPLTDLLMMGFITIYGSLRGEAVSEQL